MSLSGVKYTNSLVIIPDKVHNMRVKEMICMNPIAVFIKENRKATGLTQEEFAARSGLGLRFVRELEQGKETVRMDKVNTALAMFGYVAAPEKIERKDETK